MKRRKEVPKDKEEEDSIVVRKPKKQPLQPELVFSDEVNEDDSGGNVE